MSVASSKKGRMIMAKIMVGENSVNLNHFDAKKKALENIMQGKPITILENDYEEYKHIMNLVGKENVKILKQENQHMVKLTQMDPQLYEASISFDEAYSIINENDVPIGVIFLSIINENEIYIEWLEILTVFRQKGYLRQIFAALTNTYPNTKIRLECTEELLKKYLGIGCISEGIDECTENYILIYNP